MISVWMASSVRSTPDMDRFVDRTLLLLLLLLSPDARRARGATLQSLPSHTSKGDFPFGRRARFVRHLRRLSGSAT